MTKHNVWKPEPATAPIRVVYGAGIVPLRIWNKIRVTGNGCWQWLGSSDKRGYGRVSIGRRSEHRGFSINRLMSKVFIGEIPDGHELDHYRYPDSCIGPSCCHPEHTRPVTARENVLRANSITSWNLARTSCKRGHPLSGSNLYVKPNGCRCCVICKRNNLRKWRSRKG